MIARRSILMAGTVAALGIFTSCFGGSDATTTTAATVPSTTQAATTTSSTTTSTTSTTFPPDAALTPSSRVSTVGMGPVFVGMTVAEAEEAAGMELVGEPDPDLSPDCYFVVPEFDMEGVAFMVFEDLIARVDINPPSEAATRSGVQIGTSEQELRVLFGDQLEDGSEFVVDGVALVFVPTDEVDAEYRVVFEMAQDSTVAAYRAGILPGVGFAEGCA